MLKNNSEFHRREEIKKTMSAAALCELKFLRESPKKKSALANARESYKVNSLGEF